MLYYFERNDNFSISYFFWEGSSREANQRVKIRFLNIYSNFQNFEYENMLKRQPEINWQITLYRSIIIYMGVQATKV